MYDPAHSAVVMWAAESGSITESTNGTTAAALPALPSGFAVLGYTNLPQSSRGLNNSKGFAIGYNGAAYNKRGRIEPSISLEVRPGSLDAFAALTPNADTGVITPIAIKVIVYGKYTDIYRFCKPGSLEFRLGPDNEITITGDFQAISYQRVDNATTAATFSATDVLALGTPLFWHDVRTFTIQGAPIADGTYPSAASYRQALMSLNARVDYGLERKNERPNWGDSAPLSRTSYALLEHQVNVSGELTLHERLPASLFTGALNAQDWGDIVIYCSNSTSSTLTAGRKGFTLTLLRVMPTDESMQGGEASSEIDHTVPIVASNITFGVEDNTPPSGGGS